MVVVMEQHLDAKYKDQQCILIVKSNSSNL